jgi:hypothetical protein
VDIRINDQNLDFTIEKHETLGEVIRDLETWLNGSDMVLYSVKHRDRELLSLPQEQWAAIPNTEVGTLTVTAKHTRELVVANLQTILEFLSLLATSLEGEGSGELAALIQGFPTMVESVNKHFPDSNPSLRALAELFGAANAEEVSGWSEEKLRTAVQLIDVLSRDVAFRLQELQDPKAALAALSESLKSCIDEISEVSILLQTSKDRQAMDAIIRFSELSQSLVRLVARVVPKKGKVLKVEGKPLQGFYEELNGILSELLDAFSANDSVLIGDLMEYEIAPRLEQLRTFLQDLQQ